MHVLQNAEEGSGSPLQVPLKQIPSCLSSSDLINKAFRVAIGDLLGNISRWTGPDGRSQHVLLAGLHYDRPWTRDASINSWFALTVFWPDLARDTLSAVLITDGYGLRIGGQYWDAIIWATAAWHHYRWTGDRDFLTQAFRAVTNSLSFFENTEFDPADGLFRGGGCFFDGISGYPDRYLNPAWEPGIVGWSERHPEFRHPEGEGFPGKTLSTNCLYANAYSILLKMSNELGSRLPEGVESRLNQLQSSIRKHFGDGSDGTLRYLVDSLGTVDAQEGTGRSFAVLFRIVDEISRKKLVTSVQSTPHGIPSLYPDFERYQNDGETHFGRHGSTVWPHVNAMWAMACSQEGDHSQAWKEIRMLAEKAVRDGHFAEIYHPHSGLRYGGLQEAPSILALKEWGSEARQSWCASGFLSMITSCLFGLEPHDDELVTNVHLPRELEYIRIDGLWFRGREFSVHVRRNDTGQKEVEISFTGHAQENE